jgi:hypothetical protein
MLVRLAVWGGFSMLSSKLLISYFSPTEIATSVLIFVVPFLALGFQVLEVSETDAFHLFGVPLWSKTVRGTRLSFYGMPIGKFLPAETVRTWGPNDPALVRLLASSVPYVVRALLP